LAEQPIRNRQVAGSTPVAGPKFMNFKLKCAVCGETFWVCGSDEPDTGVVNLSEREEAWRDACEHVKDGGDYEIVDHEYDDPY
jgi:hypothetical protein